MAVREDFDITILLSEVVAPALRSVFRVGEIESVELVWEESTGRPDGKESAATALNVHLVCQGERHTSNLWTLGIEGFHRQILMDHLVNEFSDFVAESRFGWGQQR
jgi:hypothetical protein